jgi:hypothetical protein
MSILTESAPSRTTPIAIGTSAARPAGARGTAEDLLLGIVLAVALTIAAVILAAALAAAEAVMRRRPGRSLET